MPLSRAVYSVLLSRAKPALSEYDIEWNISLARGWALIHASMVLDGRAMIWPQIERSGLGRAFQKLAARIAARRKELGLPDRDPAED